MKGKAQNQNKFLRIISTPIRVLVKARDFYVRSITDCSDRVGHGGMAGVGAVHAAPLPRSFSATSSRSSTSESEDFTELLRAASSKSISGGNKIDLNSLYPKQQETMIKSNGYGSRKMPRSSSVAMGKIDEDKPYVFGDDLHSVEVKTEVKYPRSRSYAPAAKRNVVF